MNTLTIPAFSAEAAEAAQRRLDIIFASWRTFVDSLTGGVK